MPFDRAPNQEPIDDLTADPIDQYASDKSQLLLPTGRVSPSVHLAVAARGDGDPAPPQGQWACRKPTAALSRRSEALPQTDCAGPTTRRCGNVRRYRRLYQTRREP